NKEKEQKINYEAIRKYLSDRIIRFEHLKPGSISEGALKIIHTCLLNPEKVQEGLKDLNPIKVKVDGEKELAELIFFAISTDNLTNEHKAKEIEKRLKK